MRRRPAILTLSFLVACASPVPLFANVPIQGSVGGVSTADATALGATVSCRQFSVTGSEQGVNQNQCFINNTACCSNLADPTHNLDRCFRTYNTNTNLTPGGYVCNSEATAAYNNDADNQTFYNLIEGEVRSGTGDHIGFFAVQGQIASSTTPVNVGDSRFINCAGAQSAVNCFTRTDTDNSRSNPVVGTRATYGPVGNQITRIGGLSPVIPPRVGGFGQNGCAPSEIRVTWEEPHLYPGTMKNGVQTPVLGVSLYRNGNPCGAAPDGVTGWTLLGTFPLGAGFTGLCVPVAYPESAWFTTTVRVRGPGSAPFELETYRSANSFCVGDRVPTLIASLTARYAGRGIVDVAFRTGVEGGVQGYVVTRASSPTGPFTRVSELIEATGDNGSYHYADRVRASRSGMLYYRIDIMNNDGTVESSGTTGAVLPAPKGKRLGRD